MAWEMNGIVTFPADLPSDLRFASGNLSGDSGKSFGLSGTGTANPFVYSTGRFRSGEAVATRETMTSWGSIGEFTYFSVDATRYHIFNAANNLLSYRVLNKTTGSLVGGSTAGIVSVTGMPAAVFVGNNTVYVLDRNALPTEMQLYRVDDLYRLVRGTSKWGEGVWDTFVWDESDISIEGGPNTTSLVNPTLISDGTYIWLAGISSLNANQVLAWCWRVSDGARVESRDLSYLDSEAELSRVAMVSPGKIYVFRRGASEGEISNTAREFEFIVRPEVTWGGLETPLGTPAGTTFHSFSSIFYIDVTWTSDVGSQFTKEDITIRSLVEESVTYEVDRVTNVGASGTSRHFRVRFTGDGQPGLRFTDQVEIHIPDGAVTVASIPNSASTVNLRLNAFIPTAVVTTSRVNWEVPAGIQESAFDVRGVWNVAVTNFTEADINVSAGAVSGFTYSATTRIFSFTLTPPASGDGVITISITSANISPSLAEDQIVRVAYGLLAQAVTFVAWTPPVGVQRQTFPISGTWSRAVTGFTESDVQVSAGTKSDFTYSDATRTFSLMVTPPASPPSATPDDVRDLTISIPTTAVTPEPASCQTETVPYAPPIPPFVYWRLPRGIQTSRFNLSGFWSKDVTGFARSHVTLSTGTITNFNSCGRRFSFTITPPSQGSGTIVITIAANSVTPANNLLTENIGYRSADAPFVTWDVPTGIQQGAFDVRGTWSEPVTGFASTSVQISAGTLTNFSYCPGSREFTFVLTPPSDSSGILRITIDATAVSPNALEPQTVEVPYTQPSPLTKVGLEGANVIITPLIKKISETVATPAFLVEFDEDVELPSGAGLETDFPAWLEMAGIQIPDASITVRETDTRTIFAQNPPCSTRRFAYGVDYTLRIEVRPPLASTPSASGFTVTGATLTSITSVGSGRLYDLLIEFPSTGTGTTQVKANASYFTGVDADITLMECLYGESNLRVINFPTGVIPEESEVSFQIACEPALTATPQPSAIQLSAGTVTGLCEAGVGTLYNVQIRMPSGTGTVTVTALAAGFTNITANQVLGTIQYRAV